MCDSLCHGYKTKGSYKAAAPTPHEGPFTYSIPQPSREHNFVLDKNEKIKMLHIKRDNSKCSKCVCLEKKNILDILELNLAHTLKFSPMVIQLAVF